MARRSACQERGLRVQRTLAYGSRVQASWGLGQIDALPATSISPNLLKPPSLRPCLDAVFESLQRHRRTKKLFFEIAGLQDGEGVTDDVVEATQRVQWIEEFDKNCNVFTINAHDPDQIDIVELPQRLSMSGQKRGRETREMSSLGGFQEGHKRG